MKKILISRRELLTAAGAGTLYLQSGIAGSAFLPGAGSSGSERSVTVREGTNIAAAASPDGKTIAFDLYGVLWVMSTEGGAARRLTDDYGEIGQPDWSPDGSTLIFQSYRDGNFHLWSIGAGGKGLTQLTHGPRDDREPRFSPDGQTVAFSSDRSGRYAIHVLELRSGDIRQLTQSQATESEPAWSPDGKRIAFIADNTRLQLAELDGQVHTRLSGSAVLHAPSFTPDGKSLVYTAFANANSSTLMSAEERGTVTELVANEDVFPFRVTWLSDDELLYASNGKMRRLHLSREAARSSRTIEFTATVPVVTPQYRKKTRDFDSVTPKAVIGIGSPVLSPDGHHVAFRALNDLWTMRIGEEPQPLLRDRFFKCDAAWSPDGNHLAYSSDRGGKLDIWIRDLKTGADRQVTRFTSAAVSGSWSRDGQSIAFLDQTGALHVVNVATGALRKVFESLWEPGRPSWSPDGRFIAMAAFKPYSKRYREGLSEILVVDLSNGTGTYTPPWPDRSLSTRGDDGPIWSPDGRHMAFVMASTLWVVPVDSTGRFTAAPLRLNREVTDAPTWSGDAKSILYLSNGKLRLISVQSGAPRDVPLKLHWRNAKPEGRTIVRAGRVWDGLSPNYRSAVDVVIAGNRIESVLPAASGTPSDRNVRFVDAPSLTLMPGLIDMHTHRQMQGYAFGDRQGRLLLAMGVTSTRSPGAPAYHMVEDRESIDAGLRVAPRHFATGEAIDGSRIYYNFMRPLTEPGQLELELQRAEALSYDMMKTYVRLPVNQQQKVIEWAHRKGLHVSSHYHYPAVRFGGDCTEHLGASNRFGYSRTITALGAAYQDVEDLYVQSRAARTTTLFNAAVLFAEDRSLIDDIRVKALYPSWEYVRLLEYARNMAANDPAATLANLQRSVAQVKAILRRGGVILCGTDAPIDFVGVSLHLNLRAMVKFGLTPYEALLTTTRTPGEFLGEPIGKVTAGALADLVLVAGDPLKRIDDAAAVRQVIRNGAVFTVEELMSPFA